VTCSGQPPAKVILNPLQDPSIGLIRTLERAVLMAALSFCLPGIILVLAAPWKMDAA
jgi:hypothetical protein